MAVYTSVAGTGNWSVGATWSGGVAPPSGAGHTVTIIAGSTVTADVNWDIGSSGGAGTAAITVAGPGPTSKLIIGAGVTLIARGDLLLNDAPFTMNAGAILEFDSSAAGSVNYKLQCGNSSGNTNVVINLVGTSGARCQIRSNAGGGTASISQTPGRARVTVRYCDFTRMGSASASSIEGKEFDFDLENCIFDTCGRMLLYVSNATTVWRLVNVTMKNTVSATCLGPGSGNTALTSGTRVIQNCVFDKVVTHDWRDYTVTNTIFQGSPTGTTAPIGASGNTAGWASFTNNFLTWTAGSSDANFNGSIENCYCFNSYAVANPHWFQVYSGLTLATVTVSGCVFEDGNSRTDGDCIMVGTPPVAQTLIVENNLGIPNASRTAMGGTLVTAHGNANSTVRIRHNTWFLGTTCVNIGEAYAGHAGQIAEMRDNICYDDVAGGATSYKMNDSVGTVPDHALAAGIHHNAGFNHATGSNLKGYNNLNFASGTPGASDVDNIDPDFVDDTRDLAAWDASIAGGGGSAAHAIAELIKINEAGYNAAYNIAALVTWVKAGFVPQAGEYDAASDSVSPSNGWIGALEGTTAAPAAESSLSLLGVG